MAITANRTAALCLAATLLVGAERAPVADAMQGAAESIGALLAMATEPAGLGAPAMRASAERAFDQLQNSSTALFRHAAQRDADFLLLSAGMVAQVRWASSEFDRGRFREAEDLIYRTTNHCSSCHAKLPATPSSGLGESWLDRVGLAELERPERARLLVAVRQFDDALDEWEAEMSDPLIPPMKSDLAGWFADYLAIVLRVSAEPERARQAFAALSGRENTPLYLEQQLSRWIDALEDLEDEVGPVSGDVVARTRELVERGHRSSPHPTARDALVYDLAASGVLLRWLDANARSEAPDVRPSTRAEVWFLLAAIDDRVNLHRGRARTEWHMEQVLRADPGGRFSERAFARLEASVMMHYGVFKQSALPSREAEWLVELGKLVSAPPDPR